ELERLFRLTSFDVDCLLICLASEIDPRYERLYAYLQDDVTRKWPSVGLILDLLCSSFPAKIVERERFTTGAPLIESRLVSVFEEPAQPPATLLGKYLRIEERIVSYLLGSDKLDTRVFPYVRSVKPASSLEELVLPEQLKKRLSALVQSRIAERT